MGALDCPALSYHSCHSQRFRALGCKELPREIESGSASDADTAAPSAEPSTAAPTPDASPSPSTLGSPMQTPSPLLARRVPWCQLGASAWERRAMPDCECPADLVLQTPSPVLPTWLPARSHPAAETWIIRTQSHDDIDSDSDNDSVSDSDFSDGFDDIADARGPCCHCLNGMRPSRQPFQSFLLPHEVDEDLCAACEAARSMITSPHDLSSEMRFHSPDAILNSPGEAFWR